MSERAIEGLSERIPAECFPVQEFIRDEMEDRGWSVEELAQRMRPRSVASEPSWHYQAEHIHQLLDGERGLTLMDATGLGRAFGTSEQLWLNLNGNYIEWTALQEGKALAREPHHD